jgi:aldose 1-epimerase
VRKTLKEAMDELILETTDARAIVRPDLGGRVGSFVVGGRELLVTDDSGLFFWGSFPMAPWAGRVRRGIFDFDGQTYHLPINFEQHAIHGTVVSSTWQTLDAETIASDLADPWPFRGRVTQRFHIAPGELTVRMELDADEPMPASIGWHPWFRRRLSVPEKSDRLDESAGALQLDVDAQAMYLRDEDGIPSGRMVPPSPRPWEDCFTDLRHPPVLRWAGVLELTIESTCADWVIYDKPEHAICVEPQTAPPDAFNLPVARQTTAQPGTPLVAEMIWRWRTL